MKYSEQELEEIIDGMKQLLTEYKAADDKFRDDQDSKYWNDKYGERLSPYCDKIKLLNGDDFSLIDEARKEYHSQYSDLSDDEYVNALEANIKATLQRIWPEAEPEQIEQATQEIVENTEGESAEGTETTEETTVTETTDDEGNKEVEVETEEPEVKEEDEEDPVEAFRKELEEEKAKMPKRGE